MHVFADTQYPVFTNAIGCFDEDRNAVARGDYILLLGDSFTWGYTPFEKKWGTILESELNKPVMKCGVGGYGLKQEIEKGKKVVRRLKKSPELILIG